MRKLLVACDIDGTLIDTSKSFTRIARELSGATLEEVRAFRALGGFNDDWELTRSLCAWINAGRPVSIEAQLGVWKNWQDVVAAVGHDPGNLAERCIALYRGGYWRDEVPLVDADLLDGVADNHAVVACTGRDAWEFERAEEMLGFNFLRATTMEQVKKPDPQALLRLFDGEDAIILIGDTAADRMCVERAAKIASVPVGFVDVEHHPARGVLQALVAGGEPDGIVWYLT